MFLFVFLNLDKTWNRFQENQNSNQGKGKPTAQEGGSSGAIAGRRLSPQSPLSSLYFSLRHRRLQCGLWLLTQFSEVSLRKQALGLGGLAGRLSGFLRQFGQDLHAAGRDEDCVLKLCGPETHRGAVRTLVCTLPPQQFKRNRANTFGCPVKPQSTRPP